MRPVRGVLVLCALAVAGLAQSKEALEEYRARRAAVRKALPDGITVLFGRGETSEDEHHAGFVQEPNFYYLTGWNEPGAILLLTPLNAKPGAGPGEILFLPLQDTRSQIYSGRKLSPEDEDARAVTGFESVLPKTAFETQLRQALEHHSKIYTLANLPAAEKLRSMLPLREVADARAKIAELRVKKSAREIELIRKSVDVTMEAQRAAWKRVAPGVYEYQIAAAVVGTFLERGCERPAYPPIIGSGPNALVLHYENNSRRMEPGELLLMDVGASCAGYAADLTRTVPVSGKFTARQRELYNVVLGAWKAAVQAARPGVLLGTKETPNSLNKIVYDYLNSRGKDRDGKPLGQYLPHGIAHRVGLSVHDVYKETLNVPLQPGDVLAIEPGVYIRDEGIGIRIEDLVLITENGARVLSAALPREPGEIEDALAR